MQSSLSRPGLSERLRFPPVFKDYARHERERERERQYSSFNCFTASRKGACAVQVQGDCALFAYVVEILTNAPAIARMRQASDT